jgi:hypothetical protein
MYAYAYQKPAKAKRVLQNLDANLLTCRECSSCAVDCQMGFAVAEKIRDIRRLLDIPDDFLV